MAPINSQTTNWQCNKKFNGTQVRCGNGNVITKTRCKSFRCGKERSKGDLAMSIMDEVLGIFTSRDEVDYDEDADAFGPLNIGNEFSDGSGNGSGNGGGNGGGRGNGGNGGGNNSGYRPASSAADDYRADQAARRYSRRGRCT